MILNQSNLILKNQTREKKKLLGEMVDATEMELCGSVCMHVHFYSITMVKRKRQTNKLELNGNKFKWLEHIALAAMAAVARNSSSSSGIDQTRRCILLVLYARACRSKISSFSYTI